MTKLIVILSSLCLAQCAGSHRVDSKTNPNRTITEADVGKVISERYYEIDGVRKVERRTVISVKPRLETRLDGRILW